jgi:hypothetical protein
MNTKLTDKQKKALLICAGLFVASYVVKWLITSAQQAAFYQQQAIIAAQQRAAAAAAAKAQKQNAAPPAAKAKQGNPRFLLTDLTNLAGAWRGQRLLARKGMCTLNLELRNVPEKPEDYKAYAQFHCMPAAGIPSLYGGRVLPKQQRDNLNPAAMVLTGVPEEGSIHFTVDKTVVTAADDCETTDFSVTPFGTNQVAVEWREGICRGTQLILAKNGNANYVRR